MVERFDGSAFEIETLFAAEIEPERYDVPGMQDSWVEVRPMDAAAYTKYVAIATRLQASAVMDGGTVRELDMNLVNQLQMTLIENTITDFCFAYKQRLKNGEGYADAKHTTEGQRDNQKREMMRKTFPQLTPLAFSWLFSLCEHVNGMNSGQEKN